MGQNSAWLHLKYLMLALVMVALSLTGCIKIEVIDHQDKADTATSPTPDEHDLAILAIDFDPPLDDYEQLLNDPEGITLMIAVENTGLSTENDGLVKTQLTADEGETILLERSVEITSIAPGETRVVRFTQIPCPPYRATYQLFVEVVQVPGETNLANNSRTYELRLVFTDKD